MFALRNWNDFSFSGDGLFAGYFGGGMFTGAVEISAIFSPFFSFNCFIVGPGIGIFAFVRSLLVFGVVESGFCFY